MDSWAVRITDQEGDAVAYSVGSDPLHAQRVADDIDKLSKDLDNGVDGLLRVEVIRIMAWPGIVTFEKRLKEALQIDDDSEVFAIVYQRPDGWWEAGRGWIRMEDAQSAGDHYEWNGSEWRIITAPARGLIPGIFSE